MSNPLFGMMNGNQIPMNNNFLQRFQQFKQAFTGDPKQRVQDLLNSGRISQDQYNRAVEMARQMQRFIGGK